MLGVFRVGKINMGNQNDFAAELRNFFSLAFFFRLKGFLLDSGLVVTRKTVSQNLGLLTGLVFEIRFLFASDS